MTLTIVEAEIITELAREHSKRREQMAHRAFVNGTNVFYATKSWLEDWEGGDELVICPVADRSGPPSHAQCWSCPCAEVHTRSDCESWTTVWGEHKDNDHCQDCEELDQFKYEEFYPPDDDHTAGHATRKLLKQAEPSFLFTKFREAKPGVNKVNNSGTYQWRRSGPPEKFSGDDILAKAMEKTDAATEKRKVTRKNTYGQGNHLAPG